jgi:hypothetical protein
MIPSRIQRREMFRGKTATILGAKVQGRGSNCRAIGIHEARGAASHPRAKVVRMTSLGWRGLAGDARSTAAPKIEAHEPHMQSWNSVYLHNFRMIRIHGVVSLKEAQPLRPYAP